MSLFLGTQYYRPPNPPQSVWEQDMERIREHGFRMVRTWIYWGKVNSKEGRYVFDDYDRFFDVAEKSGLQVLAQLMLESAPYWIENRYPDHLYTDRQGNRIEFLAMPSMASGGFPGPCLDNPKAEEFVAEFITKTVDHFKDRESLYAWDVWNEIWGPWPCYCDATQERFRRWLADRYGSIDKLNEQWQRGYEDFSEVRMPKIGQYADLCDLYAFVRELLSSSMKWRSETVRSVDPRHLVVAHHKMSCVEKSTPLALPREPRLMWHYDSGKPIDDDWKLAEPLDVWGISCYSTDLWTISCKFDGIRSSCNGKPWWLSEHSPGRRGYYLGNYHGEEAMLRSMLLLTFGHGGEGAVYWQWRPERFGEEAPHFGLTDQRGEPRIGGTVSKQITEMIQSHEERFNNMTWDDSAVGILWDPKSYDMERISLWNKGEPPLGPRNLFGFYRALMNRGYQVDFLNAEDAVSEGIAKNYALIVMPYQIIDRDGLSELISKWVSDGGTLIGGPLYGLFRSDTYTSEEVPSKEMQQVFGVREEDILYIDDPQIQLGGSLQGLSVRGTLVGSKLVEIYELLSAHVLGSWEGRPVLTRHAHGKGRAYMVGSFVGTAYADQNNSKLDDFLSAICEEAGIVPNIVASGDIYGRVAISGIERLVFLFNPGETVTHSEVLIPSIRGKAKATDLLTGEQLDEFSEERPLQVMLQGKDSTVLLVQE